MPETPAKPKKDESPQRILLVSYPKIVFMWPTFLMSFVAALYMNFTQPFDPASRGTAVVGIVFLAVLAVNMVILSFDFPRTTSLTLFFFAAAISLGLVLLFVLQPGLLPSVTAFLRRFHPAANATFYWAFVIIFLIKFLIVFGMVQFDYWEVRPNELLHHHGFLSNLERFAAPNLRIDKEINDVFEYLLLRSGRLILQPSGERRAIILDNVPFIREKEAAITRMLGALQVQVRTEQEEEEEEKL